MQPRLLLDDVSFQLSFVATLGLVLGTPVVARHLSFIPERFGIREIVGATIATTLSVLPILVYSFGTVSLVTIVSNALVLPAVPLAMLLSGLSGALGWVPVAGVVVGAAAHATLIYIITVVEVLSRVPFAAITVPNAGLFGLLISCGFSLCVFLVLFCANRPGKVPGRTAVRAH